MANQQDSSYWQQGDKSVMGSVFLMLGVFAAVMVCVAIGVSFVL